MPRHLLLFCLAALLSGCAVSEEDKAFYYRGWLNPKELDTDRPAPGGKPGGMPGSGTYQKDPLLGY